jgi:hypothetical protein
MPIYVCEKCGYFTQKKHHMTQHMKKINPCSKQIIMVNRDTNLNNLTNDTTYENYGD